jgi:ABC-type multidrug transport system ATPase subunit/ABC-type multidrug transport system permease subunit
MGQAPDRDNRTLQYKVGEVDERDSTLTVRVDGAKKSISFRLNRASIRIGRSPSQDVVIDAEGIFPSHARLKLEGVRYRLSRVGTASRVLVNDTPLEQDKLLEDGDKIRLEDGQGAGATLIYSNPIERAFTLQTQEAIFTLNKPSFLIGRDPASDIHIDSLAVSWRHALITQQGDSHQLQDLGSSNGTLVNDRLIRTPVRLRPNDIIRIDKIILLYDGTRLYRRSTLQTFQLDAHELEMAYTSGYPPKTKVTMQGASLCIQPQEFVAIIGGSGSGKSTLMRALSGVRPATGGKVYINGDDFYAKQDEYQPLIGYVPQQDIVHDDLSVYQSLWYGARLRFPREDEPDRQQRINRVLETLELTDFKNNLVKTLSGGQKKRVSIALELMAEPTLLFMDEPSSGLDPGLDYSMMNALRQLTYRGHIVVVVTHTTLNIDLCDHLCFMARGSLAYFGPPPEALEFFNVQGYADIYNRVLEDPELVALSKKGMSRASAAFSVSMLNLGALAATASDGKKHNLSPVKAGELWAEKYRKSPIYEENVVHRAKIPSAETPNDTPVRAPLPQRRGTFWQQTRVMTERTIALVRRDLRTLAVLLVILPLIGAFLAAITSNDRLFFPASEEERSRLIEDRALSERPVQNCADLPEDPDDNCQPVEPNPEKRRVSYPISTATYAPAGESQRLLFMLALAVTLLGVFASAYTIVAERNIFLRERMVNLRISAYLLSKIVVYGGLAVFSCVLLLVVLSFGVDYPPQGVLLPFGALELFVTLALTALAGVTMGLAISAFSRNLNGVTYVVLAVLFIQILFAGVLFNLGGLAEIPSRLTPTRWALEGLGVTAKVDGQDRAGELVIYTAIYNEEETPPRQLKPPLGKPSFRRNPAPSALNFTYPTTANDLLLRWGALAGFSLVFIASAAVSLNRRESF